ncbi:MAG: efflux RND transporter periplasmic adaptor subunit [Patescibacteria group bacterium]
MFKKILNLIIAKKFTTSVIALILISGSYWGIKHFTSTTEQTSYILGQVAKGAIITSVSGTGQVSASNQVDIKSKVSGEIEALYIKKGQEVKTGQLLAKIDTNDAQGAVRDAEINLETAQVQLEELLKPPDELTILQAENSLVKAMASKQDAEDNIIQGYEDAFNAITDTFFDLPTIMTGVSDILYSYNIAKSEVTIDDNLWNVSVLKNNIKYDDLPELEKFINIAENDYKIAREKYNINFQNYRDSSRYSEYSIIEALLEKTLETLRTMSEAIKSEVNLFDYWVDSRSKYNYPIFSKVTQYQSDLKSYTSKINSYLSSLLSIERSFQDNRQAVLDAEYSIKEEELSLTQLKEGADDLDIRTKKIAIEQKQAALSTAKSSLADCYIYATFDGVIAEINNDVKKGDSVSSSTVLASLITKQHLANITLNELDVAKVKIGQKANLTFDAIEGLTVTGEVADIDSIGTVSQGVVTYNVKIIFATQEDQVKSGMTVSASIITDVKQDVLLVPNSAIKSTNGNYYVEVPDENVSNNQSASTTSGIYLKNQPKRQIIEIGLANDTNTEVTNGLKEGEQIILRTVSSATSSTSQQNKSSNQGNLFLQGAGRLR